MLYLYAYSYNIYYSVSGISSWDKGQTAVQLRKFNSGTHQISKYFSPQKLCSVQRYEAMLFHFADGESYQHVLVDLHISYQCYDHWQLVGLTPIKLLNQMCLDCCVIEYLPIFISKVSL